MLSKSTLISFSLPTALFVSTLFVYIHNLAPSVYGGDAGDFLSAIAVKGVPHPSGYPLYILLGILFSYLPIHQTLAWKIDLLSAIFSSGAVILMYAISLKLTTSKLISVITALTLAFVFPFWLFAEVTEVFALHSFFMLLVFYLGILLSLSKKVKYLYLLFITTCLSFANQELTLLVLPSVVIFIISARHNSKWNSKSFFMLTGLCIVGMSPYLYIPISASHNPPINWDHASNFSNFINLILRTDFGWAGHAKAGIFNHHLSLQRYWVYLFNQFPFVFCITAPIGICTYVKKRQYTLLATVLTSFILFGPLFFYYLSYVIITGFYFGIIEKFYISSILFLLLLLPYGLQTLVKCILLCLSAISPTFSERAIYTPFFTSIFFLIPFFLFVHNFPLTDLHSNRLGDNLGKNVLRSLPKNSTVSVDLNDNIPFMSRYIQYSYAMRKDVHVFTGSDLNKLRYNSAQKLYASPLGDTTGIGDSTFYKGQVLANTNPSFILIPDYNQLNQIGKTSLMPYGLLLKITTLHDKNLDEATYLSRQQFILNNFTGTAIASDDLSHLLLLSDIPLLYSRAYTNTGIYLIARYSDYETAKKYFQKAITFSTDNDSAYEGLGDYFVSKQQCKKAEEVYDMSTQVNGIDLNEYQKLYNVVTTCLHDKVKTQKLQRLFLKYPEIFRSIKK